VPLLLLLLEELDDDELDDDLPVLELDEDDLPVLELEELDDDELDDDLPVLELNDDEPLLELEDPPGLPPATVTEVSAGRPVPVAQNPKLAVPPFPAMTSL
jgi:hypothetical protein